MRTGIITTNYGRKHIFELWCASISRLRDRFGNIPVMVASGKEDLVTCYKYNIEHIPFKNRPLSGKFNIAIKEMSNRNVDYVMILGSDDVVSNELFENILKAQEDNYSVIGVDTIYFYCLDKFNTGKLVRFGYKSKIMLGVCKTIRKDVLDGVGWKPWSVNKDEGLDADLSDNIRPFVDDTKIVSGMVTDVKGHENMNMFRVWNKRDLPELQEGQFLNGLSDKERDIINNIKQRL